MPNVLHGNHVANLWIGGGKSVALPCYDLKVASRWNAATHLCTSG